VIEIYDDEHMDDDDTAYEDDSDDDCFIFTPSPARHTVIEISDDDMDD